jgi:hypothetical protein
MGNQYKKTIVLGLDYSEFSGGITECNRKMGLLDAEMKLASEQAKAFGDNADQLRIKQEGLSQKIELQKKIVAQQAEAYDKAMTKYNGTGKEVDRLDKALLNSRTTLQRYENELRDTTKQLDKMDESAEEVEETSRSFGDTIRDVASAIGVETSPLIETLASYFDGLNEDMGKAVLTVGTLITTMGALTSQTVSHAKEVVNVSQTMGMTTNQYQAWDYVLKSVGHNAESASGDLAALAEKAKDAAEGGNDAEKTFRILGMSVKDQSGNLKSQNELFTELIFHLQAMEDVTTRNAIASDLLSTTGEKIVPLLNMTKEELVELYGAAFDTGYVLHNSLLTSASDAAYEMERFGAKMEAVKLNLGTALLPILEFFVDILNAIPAPVIEGIAVFLGLTAVFGTVTKAVITYQAAAALCSAANTALGTSGGIAAAGMGPLLGILLAIAAAIAVIVGSASALDKALGSASKAAQNAANVRPKYNARGTDYFEGGQTWVGEEGPELVTLPRGSRIASHRESVKAVGGKTGNTYIFNIQADKVEDFTRLVRLAEEERIAFRAGRVRI